jgi:hypothetical protein
MTLLMKMERPRPSHIAVALRGSSGTVKAMDLGRKTAAALLLGGILWAALSAPLCVTPVSAQTDTPTEAPTETPTEAPTDTPTEAPSETPTVDPTETPTDGPTDTPTAEPTETPTEGPTDTPTEVPTETPTDAPTDTPTDTPTETPTHTPTATPTPTPTATFTPISCPGSPLSSGCNSSGISSFLLREGLTDPTKHRMLWRFVTRPRTVPSIFGDPLNATGYALCVYDYTGGDPFLAASSAVSPGGICALGRPCWTAKGRLARGFHFRDVDRAQDATAQIILKSNESGLKTKLIFQARGAGLVFPPPAGGTFLDQDPRVKVQLINSDGACWEANYLPPAIKNFDFDPFSLFKDKCALAGQHLCQ